MSKGYSIYDRIEAIQGQQRFNTSKPYLGGTLMVHVNGLLVNLGVDNDYIEIDNTTIQFNYELTALDEVSIISIFSSDNLQDGVISNNNYNPNSLYKRYSTIVKLKYNAKYHITISLNGKYTNWSFTSKYSPMYCSVDKIRLDTGDLLNGATDEQISYMLYMNSKEVQEIVRVKDAVNGGLVVDESMNIKPIIYAKAWVRWKTDLDLVNSIYLSLCGLSGGTIKKIGVIDVERSVKLPGIKDMLARFKELFKDQDEYVRSTTTPIQSFTKAKSTVYSGRGVF